MSDSSVRYIAHYMRITTRPYLSYAPSSNRVTLIDHHMCPSLGVDRTQRPHHFPAYPAPPFHSEARCRRPRPRCVRPVRAHVTSRQAPSTTTLSSAHAILINGISPRRPAVPITPPAFPSTFLIIKTSAALLTSKHGSPIEPIQTKRAHAHIKHILLKYVCMSECD